MAIVIDIAGFALFWTFVRVCASAYFAHPHQRVLYGTKSVVVIHAALQSALITYAWFKDPILAPELKLLLAGDVHDYTVASGSRLLYYCAALFSGELVSQLVHLPFWYAGPGDNLIVAHHIIAAIGVPSRISAGRFDVFTANALTYEISTVFMGLLFFLKKPSLIYNIAGTLFTLSFVIVRILTIPATVNALYVSGLTPGVAYSTLIAERSLVGISMCMNMVWARAVVRGYYKALTKARISDKKL